MGCINSIHSDVVEDVEMLGIVFEGFELLEDVYVYPIL